MVQTINDTLNQIYFDFLNSSSSLMHSAQLIGGLGLVILAYVQYQKMMLDGEARVWGFFMKVIGLSLAIGFYPTVIQVINLPLNLITENVKEITHNEYENTTEVFSSMIFNPGTNSVNSPNQQYDQEIANYMNDSNENLESSNDSDSNSILNYVSNTSEIIHGIFFQIIFHVLTFMASVALIILNVVRTFFLVVLTIFGIFVIPFTIYPSLEGSLGSWLQKYINVYLWLPVGYILDGILSKIFYYHQNSSAFSIDGAINNNLVNLLVLCTIVSYVTIPTITSWLVNASTNAMASKVKGKTENLGKKLADVKSGGTTSIISSTK